jgi:hypothetical protein
MMNKNFDAGQHASAGPFSYVPLPCAREVGEIAS